MFGYLGRISFLSDQVGLGVQTATRNHLEVKGTPGTFVPILEPATGSRVAVIVYGTWASDWAPAAAESTCQVPMSQSDPVSPPASHVMRKLFSHSNVETE